MSRHRMVRNLTADDYDDYYYDDEDYDEEDDYDTSYAPPVKVPYNSIPTTKSNNQSLQSKPKQTQPQPTKQVPAGSTNMQKSVPKPAETKLAPSRVSKPLPGWAKPPAAVPMVASSTESTGIRMPPPGWGKPAMSTTKSSTTATATAVGITAPPPGWGKPPGILPRPSPPATSTSTDTTATRPLSSVLGVVNDDSVPKRSGSGSGSGSALPVALATPPKTQPPNRFDKPLPTCLKERQNNLPSQLSMVVLGHVDAGKSTLMGQLLIQTGKINKRSALRGVDNVAWLLDENESERARGVTMEIGTKALTTKNHRIIVLDAPGHADFIPIMITGAANADTCVLVVDAVTGEFESGFSGGGQTKEHILLAKGLGVSQVIVAVNKLDVEGWQESRYHFVSNQVVEYLIRQKFKKARIQSVPVSGLTGENILKQTEPLLRQWYTGPTLLEAMNRFKPANRQLDKPLRFIITDMFAEGKGVITRGRIAQGFVQVGDKVQVLPLGDTAVISRLEHLVSPEDGMERLTAAIAGDTVELNLSNVDPSRVAIGSIVADTADLPPVAKIAKVRVLIMDQLTVPIIRGAQVLFHMHSLDIPAVITKLLSTLKPDGSVNKEHPRALTSGMSALLELKLECKIVMETFQNCRALGRFVLRRGGATVAVGVVEDVVMR